MIGRFKLIITTVSLSFHLGDKSRDFKVDRRVITTNIIALLLGQSLHGSLRDR